MNDRIYQFLKTVAAAMMIAVAAHAKTVYNGVIVNEPALAHDASWNIDTGSGNGGGIDRISVQTQFSSATIAAVQFNDGAASTGQFTVNTPSAFPAVSATDTVTIVSTTGLQGAFLYVNNRPLRAGIEWTPVNTTTGCADALTTAINSFITGVTASSSSAVVTLTAAQSGTIGNSYTVVSSTPAAMSVSNASFQNGRNPIFLQIGQYSLVSGINFTPVATASGTAKAISDAIVASPTFSTVVTSTWAPNGVVYTTSTATGLRTNYALQSSNPSALAASGAQMTGGTDTAENLTGSYIVAPNHGLSTGLAVLLSTQSAYVFSPLTAQTTYYAIKVDANHFSLASSKANAVASVPVVFTSSSAVGGHNFTLTPLAITGTPVLKWQASNDGTVFTDIATSTTTTIDSYTAPYATAIQDFGEFNFRYLRLAVTAPSTGGLNLIVNLNAKN